MNNYQKWVAFDTILRRELRRFMRIWPQTLLPPVITIILYFVIFGQLIGGAYWHDVGLAVYPICGARTDYDVGDY